MFFFNSVKSKLLDLYATEARDLQALREHILNVMLITITILGMFALLGNVIPAIRAKEWFLVALFTLAYLAIVFITFYRRLPFHLRALSIILIPYALAVIDIARQGLNSDGLIWMFTVAVIANLLFGLRLASGIWVLEIVTLVVLGYLITSSQLTISPIPNPLRVDTWVGITVDFLLLGGVTAGSLALLINGLDKSLRETKQLTASLGQDRTQLEKHTVELERRLVQIRTVAEISHIISGELSAETLLQQVAELIRDRLNLHFVGIFLLDGHQHAILQAGTGEAGRKMVGEGYKVEVGSPSAIGWVTASARPWVSPGVGREAARMEYPHLPDSQSELILPLKTSNQVLGAITLQSTEPDAFVDDDNTILQGIANGLTATLENTRILQEAQSQLDDLNILYTASRSIVALPQQEDALRTVAIQLMKAVEADGCAISRLDRNKNEVVTEIDVSALAADPSLEFDVHYDLDEYPLTAQVLTERKPIAVRADDPEADPAEVALMNKLEVKSILMIPLVTRGEVVGLLELEDTENFREFTPPQIRLAETLSSQAASMLETNRILNQAQQLVRRERIINQITTHIQQSVDVESILTTAVLELGKALELQEAAVRIGTEAELLGSSPGKNGGIT